MAIRSVAVTNTLEEFRTTFNSLGTDVGDISGLTTTDTSDIVAAINEINSAVSTAFTIADDTSTTQQVNSGDVFRISSGSNITASVSATDTLTVALNSTVSGLTSIASTAATIGTTLVLGSGSITDTGGTISFGDDNITTTGTITGDISTTSITSSTGTVDFDNDNLTTTGSVEAATITEDSVRVATRPFAIAQSIALG